MHAALIKFTPYDLVSSFCSDTDIWSQFIIELANPFGYLSGLLHDTQPRFILKTNIPAIRKASFARFTLPNHVALTILVHVKDVA